MTKVITRFPPSPTGFFHMGSARTALFNYLYAKKHNGQFLLRFEDTDRERSKKEYEKDIIEGLEWLGIVPDNIGDVKRQSERTEIYKKYLQGLINRDLAYEAEKSEKGDGQVIRFRNPNKKIQFQDIIRGKVEFDTTELGDFVIARDIDNPIYHLAVVVDDAEMEISHIIRGQEHISNTQRQILLIEALGFSVPHYAHIPLILGEDKTKLSKRHGATSVSQYKEEYMGYTPQAVVNFLGLLGWHPTDDKEIFSLEELVEEFSLERIQKAPAIFNVEKLNWINKQHLQSIDEMTQKKYIRMHLGEKYNTEQFDRAFDSFIKERIVNYAVEQDNELMGDINAVLFDIDIQDVEKIIWKNGTKEDTISHLEFIYKTLSDIKEFTKENVKTAVWPYAEEQGRGEVLWPFRYTLTGKDKSPDPFTVSYILGKEETLKRLERVIHILKHDR